MKIRFKRIAILGCPRYSSAFIVHKILCNWLIKKGYHVVIENSISKYLNFKNIKISTSEQIGKTCDLAIVIGGDGNMLYISRKLSYFSIKIIGINCGNLGFLTDLKPDNMIHMLSEILSGRYFLENRFLLESYIINKKDKKINIAVNEMVIHSEKSSEMIEFEVYIDMKFAFYQRSDGLIISTPTGSTGYSLSAGGPIISNCVEAIVIVPMFAHNLSSRPIVINSSSIIMLKLLNLQKKIILSCDGQILIPLCYKKKIFIYKSKNFINFIHPYDYSYLDVLSSKLNWSKNFF